MTAGAPQRGCNARRHQLHGTGRQDRLVPSIPITVALELGPASYLV